MASKANISIMFKGDVPEVFTSNESIQVALKKYYGEDCAVYVGDTQLQGEDAVEFEMFSERDKNLYWQHDLLVKYLKEMYSDEVTYFNSNVWASMDDYGLYFELSDGEAFNEL